MENLFSQYRKHIRQTHERENDNPRLPTLSQSDIDHVVERDVEIARAYYKKHGELPRSPVGVRLWWDLFERKVTNFALSDSDKSWLNEVVSKMTDEQVMEWVFPDPPSGRLLYLITCLKDTSSVKGIDLQQDAYDYMMDNCPIFEERSNELCDRELAKAQSN